ncbi:MAG: hypothetical protein M3255_10520, partial [Pseudomonadota bacterium]|nr:hypothetical protein [Pseudomonadota bacterium]
MLVTSKNRSVLLRMGLQGSDLTHADRLSSDEARYVLIKIFGQEKVSAEPDAVEQLLALVGCLAMAVRIAGGAIAEQIGPRPIARDLKRLQERSTDLASALQLDGDEELQLARVFELSLDLLKPERTAVTFEVTEPRISYVQLSVCAPAGFSRAVTETVVDLPSAMAEDRLSRFVNLALLEHQAITDRFRFHPLLQSFARQKANVWDVYGKATVAHRRFFSRYVRTRAAYTAENLAALVAEQDAIMMVARERVREGE